jgi:hypothetical protein
MAVQMEFGRSNQLSDRNPKFSVAVRASADGRFTFEIFTVSGEPRTFRFESQHYSSPADAERAGYELIAANGLQTLDIDTALGRLRRSSIRHRTANRVRRSRVFLPCPRDERRFAPVAFEQPSPIP